MQALKFIPGQEGDLVVRRPGDPTGKTPGLWAVQEVVVESNLAIRVEVLHWARIPARFQREIERGYVVIWGGATNRLVVINPELTDATND